MIAQPSPSVASDVRIAPRPWKRIALAVLVAHVLALLGANWWLPSWWDERSSTMTDAVAVRVLASPASVMPAVSAPVPPLPVTPALQSAQDLPAADTPPETIAEMAPARDIASRTPTLDELPKVGGVALNAFWGDHTSGMAIGKGSIEVSFPAEGRYEIRLMTEAVGWAKVFANKPFFAQTTGSIGPGGLRPERYVHQSPRGKEEVSTFDYEKKKVSYSSLKEPLPLVKGIQDRLSFMIQLAWMMKVNPERFSLGEFVTIPMAGRNKVEDVAFLVLSDADVVLPGGVLVPAVHLSSYRKADRFSGQIDVWLDKTDRLLPVRIRFEESRGQVLDLLTARQ